MPKSLDELRALAATSPEAQKAVAESIGQMPEPSDKDVEDKDLHDWVKQLVYLIRRVAKAEASSLETALFWVRLFGFLDDLHQVTRKGDAPFSKDLSALLDELLGVFSVDERLYLNYRRDKESHPRLGAWRIDDKVPKKRWITNWTWTGLEMREAVGRVLRKYDAIYETSIQVAPALDEGRIAVGFAGKLVPMLEKIGSVIDLAFGDWRKTRLLWAGV